MSVSLSFPEDQGSFFFFFKGLHGVGSVHEEHCTLFYLYPYPRFQSKKESKTWLNTSGCLILCAKGWRPGQFFWCFVACDVQVVLRAGGVTTPEGRQTDYPTERLFRFSRTFPYTPTDCFQDLKEKATIQVGAADLLGQGKLSHNKIMGQEIEVLQSGFKMINRIHTVYSISFSPSQLVESSSS